MLYFQRKSLSFETALSYLQAFTSNSHEFLWKRSSLFQHFNSLFKENGVLLHFLNAVFSEKITFHWNCLMLHTSIHQKLHSFLWKRSSLFQQFISLCEVNGVLHHFLNAVLSEKITFFWKCLRLLTSIHKKLTCISLKEKESVPTLQLTVRSEWNVASLSKCCTFRENHFPLKLPCVTYKHSPATHMHFSAREAVCSNTSLQCAKGMDCYFTF